MIKKLVGVQVQAQATPFFATVQMMAEDIRPELDKIWEENKGQFAGQTIKQDGFRPRPITQADVEGQHLTQFYGQFWLEQLVDGIQSKTGRRVGYVTDVAASKQGNMYIVNAIVFPQPEVTWLPDRDTFMKDAAAIFLSSKPVEDHHVDDEIAIRRKRTQFNERRLKIDNDYQEVLKEGDLVFAEITNEVAKAHNKPPEKHIIGLGPQCPAYLREVIVGSKVGTTVLAGQNLDPEGKQKVTLIVKIMGYVIAPEVTDEELLKEQDYVSMEAMRFNVKREIARNLSSNFENLFSEFLRTRTQLTPIPGAMVFDRAEGVVNHILSTKSVAELRRVGVTDPAMEIQKILPRMNDEIHRECVCAEIAKELGLEVTQDDLDDFADRNGTKITAEVQYVAEMDICLRKVYTYYRSKGEDRGDIKRIEIAKTLNNLPLPTGDKQPKSNLIHLK